MRVVLDTNIYVSALVSSSGVPAQIIELFQHGIIEVLTSEATIRELSRVLLYPKLKDRYGYSDQDIAAVINILRTDAIMIEPRETLNVVEDDETDNRFIELAVEGNAQYIVSGDKHLHRVGVYKGLRIVTPATFVGLIQDINS